MKRMTSIIKILMGIVSLFLFGVAGSIEIDSFSIKECLPFILVGILIEAAGFVFLFRSEAVYED